MEFHLFYNGIFSQWYRCEFHVEGVKYNCAEQFMMAEKARLFEDSKTLAKILKAMHPREQKALGREVEGFDKRAWDAVARDKVYEGNYAKFTQDAYLETQMLAVQGTFVEASPTDDIWGIGRGIDDKLALNRATWRGTNWLGEVLTKVRDDIKIGVKSTSFSWS